jgi:hypothetical protein
MPSTLHHCRHIFNRISTHRLLAAALLLAPLSATPAPPTTFGTQIGYPLLCLDQLNSNFFYSYLSTFFGAPYKKEDGAYWFKTEGATLWGMKVSEVIVGDLTSEVEFIGAVVETTPPQLATAIKNNAGILYQAIETKTYPIRESKPGSRIIYANDKSKIYCAKAKLLLNPSDVPMRMLPKTPRLLEQR